MMARYPTLGVLFAFMLFTLLSFGVQAQTLRDPTISPAAPAQPGAVVAKKKRVESTDVQPPFTVMVINGRPHLVLGTRLYAQGQKIGDATLERVTETEVWLREDRELRKISNFSGIQRRNASTGATDAACASGLNKPAKTTRASKTSTPAVACDGDKP